jgi:hypothetical protein
MESKKHVTPRKQIRSAHSHRNSRIAELITYNELRSEPKSDITKLANNIKITQQYYKYILIKNLEITKQNEIMLRNTETSI